MAYELEVTIPGLKLDSLNKMVVVASIGARYGAAAKAKKQRHSVWLVLNSKGKPPKPPLTIAITRIGSGKLDSDNLAGACKHVRDGVADWLGVDDGSELLDWRYAQESLGKGVYGVRVKIVAVQ